jgi:hypothetical protein
MSLREWFRDLREAVKPLPMLADVARAFARVPNDGKDMERIGHRVIYTGSFPMPTKDEMDTILADADLAAELRWKALEEAREREAERSAQPAQRVVQFGRVRS